MAAVYQMQLRRVVSQITRQKNLTCQICVALQPNFFITKNGCSQPQISQRHYSDTANPRSKTPVTLSTKKNLQKEKQGEDKDTKAHMGKASPKEKVKTYDKLVENVGKEIYPEVKQSEDRKKMKSEIMDKIFQMEDLKPINDAEFVSSMFENTSNQSTTALKKHGPPAERTSSTFENTSNQSTTAQKKHGLPAESRTSDSYKGKVLKHMNNIDTSRTMRSGDSFKSNRENFLKREDSIDTSKKNLRDSFKSNRENFLKREDNIDISKKFRFDLESAGRLGVFPEGIALKREQPKPPPADTSKWTAQDWFNKYESDVRENVCLKDTITNQFQEHIKLTKEGKMWAFPINNEEGMEKEQEVPFYSHVFLEDRLEGWCPKSGPLRLFMNAVTMSLSLNGHLTLEEKHEHIDWFRQYFDEKLKILQHLGVVSS